MRGESDGAEFSMKHRKGTNIHSITLEEDTKAENL